jgi:aspartyl-tRNA synthetase
MKNLTNFEDAIKGTFFEELLETPTSAINLPILSGDLEVGPVPHIAFGMGLERMMRWLLNIPHVRDGIAFPRVVRRTIYP